MRDPDCSQGGGWRAASPQVAAAAVAHIAVGRVRQARHRLMVQQLADPVPIPTTSRAARQLTQDLYIPWRLRAAVKYPGAPKNSPR
jgi:hypothetical protein